MNNITDYIENELEGFLEESNRIEGIHEVSKEDILATTRFLHGELTSYCVELLCLSYTNGEGELRSKIDMDVHIKNKKTGEIFHVAPLGGDIIVLRFHDLLMDIKGNKIRPFKAHCRFETLHPFMDGNGRTGRAVWLWQMLRHPAGRYDGRIGFLHTFYYQTLENTGRK